MPGIRKPGPVGPRFWSKVDKKGIDECWTWLASSGFRDYGKFKLNGTYVSAHRVAYELAIGPIPEGLVVCHKCDNPACCNPNHLFVATQRENNLDKIIKGRHSFKAPDIAFTPEQADKIRKEYEHETISYTELGNRHNVSKFCIYTVINHLGVYA